VRMRELREQWEIERDCQTAGEREQQQSRPTTGTTGTTGTRGRGATAAGRSTAGRSTTASSSIFSFPPVQVQPKPRPEGVDLELLPGPGCVQLAHGSYGPGEGSDEMSRLFAWLRSWFRRPRPRAVSPRR
jgi:hypothetical protein